MRARRVSSDEWFCPLQLPVAIALEDAHAVVYLADGRRILGKGEMQKALARKDAELGRKDAEIERLRRLLEGRS